MVFIFFHLQVPTQISISTFFMGYAYILKGLGLQVN